MISINGWELLNYKVKETLPRLCKSVDDIVNAYGNVSVNVEQGKSSQVLVNLDSQSVISSRSTESVCIVQVYFIRVGLSP